MRVTSSLNLVGRTARWLRRRPGRGAGGAAAARAEREGLLLRAQRAGFPVAPAAHPSGYGCSCDRIGCPSPAAHPVSFAWQTQATTDPVQVRRWLAMMPEANFVTATGRSQDVLDVPGRLARAALERIAPDAPEAGPVALLAEADRYLFFTATRAALDEDEWWPCELDCRPETVADHPGLRWHCRGSYVLLPPSRPAFGAAVSWLRGPELALPDPLRVLAVIAELPQDAAATDPAGAGEKDGAAGAVPAG